MEVSRRPPTEPLSVPFPTLGVKEGHRRESRVAETKRILCLANSRKMSGRCVAGVEIGERGFGAWVRPVSNRPTHEVSEAEREYHDGSDPQVLDVMDVPLISHSPFGFQTENWLLDPTIYWERRGALDWDQLAPLLDDGRPLWVGGQSSYNGENDRVPEQTATSLSDSLRLTRVDSAVLRVMEGFSGRREVRAGFEHAGSTYWLKVTDPVMERSAKQRDNGDYEMGESALTISLGETFQGYAYKLVAAVIPRR